jgi:hypothetical protein
MQIVLYFIATLSSLNFILHFCKRNFKNIYLLKVSAFVLYFFTIIYTRLCVANFTQIISC